MPMPAAKDNPRAHIGSFTLKDGKYIGTVRTMTSNVKDQLVPNSSKTSDDALDYRLYAGR